MSQYFCIRLEFLGGRFHGRGEGGEPEWPPSPLRVFQALTAACAALANERKEVQTFAEPLRWLERQDAPRIHAPAARAAQPYRLYVPNNSGDIVARSWDKGGEASLAKHRTEKDVRPLVLEDQQPLHYLWALHESDAAATAHTEALAEAVRVITHLGWGIDQVTADARIIDSTEADALIGERYIPVHQAAARRLPAPVPGTLAALTARHQAALGRIRRESKNQVFVPVPRLTTLRWVDYVTADEPLALDIRVFALAPVPSKDGNPRTNAQFQAFDAVHQTRALVGMVRGLVTNAAFQDQLGWEPSQLAKLHGHGEARGEASHQPVEGPRLAIVPLPSYEWLGSHRGLNIGDSRRLLITMLKGSDAPALDDIAHLLAGRQLQRDPVEETQQPDKKVKTPEALLMPIEPDKMVREHYTARAHTWATVTPVVLPGHDDPGGVRRKLASRKNDLDSERKNELIRRLDARTELLLRRAIVQAGYSQTLANHAEIAWRSGGFLPGLALASEFDVPDHLQHFRKVHVRITWRDCSGNLLKLPGPLLLGGGRFVGFGLFVPLSRENE